MAGQRNSLTRMFVEREWRDREERAIVDLVRSVVWGGCRRSAMGGIGAHVRAVLEAAERGAPGFGRGLRLRERASSERLVPLETCGRVARNGLLGDERRTSVCGREGDEKRAEQGSYNDIPWWAAKWILLGGWVGMFWAVALRGGCRAIRRRARTGVGGCSLHVRRQFFEGFPLWAGDKDDPVDTDGRNGRATEGEIVCLVVDAGCGDDVEFLRLRTACLDLSTLHELLNANTACVRLILNWN